MTGFDFYRSLRKRYPHVQPRLLGAEETAEYINGCNNTFRANCGELLRLSEFAVRRAIIDLIKRGGLFESTCGKLLYGEENGSNPLINDLIKEGLLGNGGHLNYTEATTLEQTLFGATHAFIWDDGDKVFIEEPHGCINNEPRKGLFFEQANDLVKEFASFAWHNVGYREIMPLADDTIDDSISKFIFTKSNPGWDEFGYEYSDEVQFDERLRVFIERVS
ncbi:MAG: hypothetical protein FWB91_13710 [Defluviitaleaceae bacterium]|nr:hypothetical protein [Defluviitaleaceae bacterium]MCL2218058.1 hypothetical protein [Defluviitaleaceae bacterium]